MSGISRLLEKAASRLTAELFAFISSPLCADCKAELDDVQKPLCLHCREKFERQAAGVGPVCLICRNSTESTCDCAEIRGGRVPSAYYFAPYSETMKTLIHRFKFEGDRNCGGYLISIAVPAMRRRLESISCDMIIPIPMRRRDINDRGFNQTHLIASALAEALHIPYKKEILVKTRNTDMQAVLPAERRWQNVIGAFTVAHGRLVQDASVLLVDDIITTGATCFEAARALYSAGARKVTVFAIASAE